MVSHFGFLGTYVGYLDTDGFISLAGGWAVEIREKPESPVPRGANRGINLLTLESRTCYRP